jgi:hypothetical protein
MDFLRRLVSSRQTDATRAFALLPSRFASQSPLQQGIPGQGWPAQRIDDDETPLSAEAASPSAAQRGYPLTSVKSSQTAPRPHADAPTRRDNEKASSPAHAPTEAPGIDVARVGHDWQKQERASPACAEPKGLAAATSTATGHLQNARATPVQAHETWPLSHASLAQRALKAQDDKQVVHVTIGRIDVVANTAPAPAVQRTAAPRQATVTLADYLRGSKGRRQ